MHENLATSYVLVDSLVADLCEGGFSGIVEIVLSHMRAFVVIARGKLAAAIETQADNLPADRGDKTVASRPYYSRTTIAELAAASRHERGRISIYSYPIGVAKAVASRVTAEPLYTRLSTDFADLEKMIAKLSRERDRQWFVEIGTESGIEALVHIKDDRCHVMTSEQHVHLEETDELDLSDNAMLRGLLDECNRAGCTFDVYFKLAADAAEASEPDSIESGTLASPEPASYAAAPNLIERERTEAQEDVSRTMDEAKAIYSSLSLDDAPLELEQIEIAPPTETEATHAAETREAQVGHAEAEQTLEPIAASEPASIAQAAGAGDEGLSLDLVDSAGEQAEELLLVRKEVDGAGEFEQSDEALLMAEIKRLMSDIARTIEDATKAIEQRDSFSMYLRTGQLKIADRYPFLDPFGAEFEYLGGEIAFIGQASPEEFIAGLTEALKLAVESVAQSSTQSARLRARIIEDLRWLYNRYQQEFQQYGLDKTIAEIISG